MAAREVVVGVCQVAPRLGDRAANHVLIEQQVRSAAREGARLVVLPELVTTGYVLEREEVRRWAEPLDGPTVGLLHALAAELGLVVVAGLAEADGTELRNTAVLVDHDGLRAAYRKVHLWDREAEIFRPGEEHAPVVDTAAGRVGMVVCYDLEFPEWTRRVALERADVICAPTNWPAEARPPGERPIELVRVQAAASVNRVFVAVADRVGRERGVEWVGGSAVVAPDGYPLALVRDPGREQLLLARCDLALARDKRTGASNDVFGDRRPHLYGDPRPPEEATP